MHPCSDIEERQERQRHSTARTPCTLRHWEQNKQAAMLKHYPTFVDSTLIQRHLQSSSKTPSHQTALSSKPGSACISLLFHYTLSVTLSNLSLAGFPALQCYPFPLLSPHIFSICPSPLVLSRLFLCCLLQSLAQSSVGQHVPAKNHNGVGSAT